MRFKQVGSRLKQIREHLGYTQKDFAKHIGASYRGWQANESGTMPGGELLLKLTEIGVNINWILTGEGNPWNPSDNSTDTPGDAQSIIDLALFDEVIQCFRSTDSGSKDIPLEHLIHNVIAVYNGAVDFEKSGRSVFVKLQFNLYSQQFCHQSLAEIGTADPLAREGLEKRLFLLTEEEKVLRNELARKG